MKAFISYSHKDAPILDFLHKHLAQLQREGLITTWTDNEIPAGGKIDKAIAKELSSSELFIALVSPDYIASGYCYDVEFEKALKLQESGNVIILPIIIEPCEWLNTPFRQFKALPKDGKAITLWDNRNTAFLDVAQNIRRLIQGQPDDKASKSSSVAPPRNYQIQKDFDSIEKLEFAEKTFKDVKSLLIRYIDEVTQLDNIKARVLTDKEDRFECMLVNRNKIATESQLTVTTDNDPQMRRSNENQIQYSITNSRRSGSRRFVLAFDNYRLFWREQNFMMTYHGSVAEGELDAQKIAEAIWSEWLESVGIL